MQEELRIRRLEAERQKEKNEQQVRQLTNSQMMPHPTDETAI